MRPFAPFTIFLPAIALVFASIAPAHADKPKWTMMSDSKQVSLIYGDGSEESDLVLSCKLRGNSVRFFIGETDASLKPNMKVTASITVGAAKAAIAGKTVPNELAGVPSFIGDLPSTDPLFDAMATAPACLTWYMVTSLASPMRWRMRSHALPLARLSRSSGPGSKPLLNT